MAGRPTASRTQRYHTCGILVKSRLIAELLPLRSGIHYRPLFLLLFASYFFPIFYFFSPNTVQGQGFPTSHDLVVAKNRVLAEPSRDVMSNSASQPSGTLAPALLH